MKNGAKVYGPVETVREGLKDPYDTKTGNGFMVQNAIMRSSLSAYAKLLYAALRMELHYGLGFTFIGTDKLASNISASDRTVTKAIKELVYHKIISVECIRNEAGRKKNFYRLLPECEWRLPAQRVEDDKAS